MYRNQQRRTFVVPRAAPAAALPAGAAPPLAGSSDGVLAAADAPAKLELPGGLKRKAGSVDAGLADPAGPSSAAADATAPGKENLEPAAPAPGTAAAAAPCDAPAPLPAPKPRFRAPLARPPLSSASPAAAASCAAADAGAGAGAPQAVPSRFFTVLYTKRDKWKKKSGKNYCDGVVELKGDGQCCLHDMEGKPVTRCKVRAPPALECGAVLELGAYVAEYDRHVDEAEFRDGKCFVEASVLAAVPAAAHHLMPRPAAAAAAAAAGGHTRPALGAALKRPSAGPAAAAPAAGKQTAGAAPPPPPPPAPALAPLHDPHHPEALVLNKQQWEGAAGTGVVPVVVDPYIGRHLRPHQRLGVQFLFECVAGLRSPEHLGCVLADAMGLGKTLQVISLIWTLLRQGPQGAPLIRKAVVVAPATLVNNWGKEVKKWLGPERLRTVLLTQGPAVAQAVADFKMGTVCKLLIGSYEALRKHGPELAGCCDLLVCDEGHRLKAAGGNKTIAALLALGCKRRVVLTGTPVQNNMDEFYALLSFATPGLLGSAATFKGVYGDPITRGRDKDATPADKELGEARARALQREVSAYMLRRTQEVLAQHLPPLRVFVLFCAPAPLQVAVYRHVLRSPSVCSLLSGTGGASDEGVLPAITVLRKLCNHPQLLQQACAGGGPAGGGRADAGAAAAASSGARAADAAWAALQKEAPGQPLDQVELSGKLAVLASMLSAILGSGSGERVVLVSTSTSALDLMDAMLCRPQGYRTVRIDGSTSVDERQAVVDGFNNLGTGQVFLLSTRAGGAGLNLVGANHLVLFDSDWNPAMDAQAMARIWRDGQRRPCFVYRLLTTGTIEEKVYQRQLMKSDLADATIESGGSVGQLSHQELKQLFHLEAAGAPGCSTQRLVLGHCHGSKSRSGSSGGGRGRGGGGSAAVGGEGGAPAAAAGRFAWMDLEQGAGLPWALQAAAGTGRVSAACEQSSAANGAAAAAGAGGRGEPEQEQEQEQEGDEVQRPQATEGDEEEEGDDLDEVEEEEEEGLLAVRGGRRVAKRSSHALSSDSECSQGQVEEGARASGLGGEQEELDGVGCLEVD